MHEDRLRGFREEQFAKCEEVGESVIEESLTLDECPVNPDLARLWLDRRKTERRDKMTADAVLAAQRAADAAERSARYTRAAAWASAIAAIVAFAVAVFSRSP